MCYRTFVVSFREDAQVRGAVRFAAQRKNINSTSLLGATSFVSSGFRKSQPFWLGVDSFKQQISEIKQVLGLFSLQCPLMCAIIAVLADTRR